MLHIVFVRYEVELEWDVVFVYRFVECGDCGRKLHQICVLHLDAIWPNGYVLCPHDIWNSAMQDCVRMHKRM